MEDMTEFKPIDQKFRWWLSSFCDKDHDMRLSMFGALYRFDEKLDALVGASGSMINLSYWHTDKEGKVQDYRPAFVYRLTKRSLELLPIDSESGKVDDGEPTCTFQLMRFVRTDFDMEHASMYLKERK